jgi:hypothetical protein
MTKKTGMIKSNPNRQSGDLIIYGLIPNDLISLREPNGYGSKGGKVGAHAHHAGVQILKYANHPDVKAYIKDGLEHGADHFNTTITLDATTKQIDTIIEMAQRFGYVADKVVDPSYPFFVDRETAHLLDDRCIVVWDVTQDNKVLVTRNQTTFGWLLGDKTNDSIFRALVGALRLAE